MNRLRDIFELYETMQPGERGTLATVFRTEGSTYRRTGARMLVTASGRTAGAISGGCLERDVLERAGRVMRTGMPLVVCYDGAADDPVFGLGTGCRGTVEALVEPVCGADPDGLLHWLKEGLVRREPGAVATIVQGSCSIPLGLCAAVRGSREQILPPNPQPSNLSFSLACWLTGRAQEALYEGSGGIRSARFHGEPVQAFVEYLPAPTSLAIFGAGDDALPLARCARQLGWYVAVVDHRPAYANSARIPEADSVVCAHGEEAVELVGPCDAAVVMTHNFQADQELLRALLPRPLKYLGVLGPRDRTERLLEGTGVQAFMRSGDPPAPKSEEAGVQALGRSGGMDYLYAPAGLDLGAESPAEIALSIVAEIQSVLAGRATPGLRDRPGPIHSRQPSVVSRRSSVVSRQSAACTRHAA